MAKSGSDERLIAAIVHLSIFFLPIVLPLVVWVIEKDKTSKQWLAEQCKQALVYQGVLTVAGTVLGIVASILIVATFGFGALIILPIAGIAGLIVVIIAILAAIKAFNGEDYKYPLVGGLFK